MFYMHEHEHAHGLDDNDLHTGGYHDELTIAGGYSVTVTGYTEERTLLQWNLHPWDINQWL